MDNYYELFLTISPKTVGILLELFLLSTIIVCFVEAANEGITKGPL